MSITKKKISIRSTKKYFWIKTNLISVSPKVILGSDVLIRVLGALLKRGLVLPVLPMFTPEVVGIDGCDDEGRGNDTVFGLRWLRQNHSPYSARRTPPIFMWDLGKTH